MEDAEDYFEEMLELLSYVTYYTYQISPQVRANAISPSFTSRDRVEACSP